MVDAAAVGTAAVACWLDVRTRRIPNVLTLGAAAAAAVYFLATEGLPGLGRSIAGWGVGLLVMLPLFLLRGLGGGDVKLLAALGSWLGPWDGLRLALAAAIVGGPLALLVAFSKGYAKQAVSNVWGLLTYWRVAGLRVHPALNLDTSGAPRLPYAVPIAIGLLVIRWGRW